MFPLLINALLTKIGGFRWTLRILAGIVAVCGGVSLLGIRPRLPIAPATNPAAAIPPVNLGFFKSWLFVTMVCDRDHMLYYLLLPTHYHQRRSQPWYRPWLTSLCHCTFRHTQPQLDYRPSMEPSPSLYSIYLVS